jgi:cytochrome c peroxidase
MGPFFFNKHKVPSTMEKWNARFTILVAVLAFASCKPQSSFDGDKAVHRWFDRRADTLVARLGHMAYLVESGADAGRIRLSFDSCRDRYKQIETVVEYYFQGLSKRINGPALPDIKTDDNMVFPPRGFQVVESMVYGDFHDSLRTGLANELRVLQTDLRFTRSNFKEQTVLPRHIREMVQHEIIRIGVLGVTGFDAPVSFRSLVEAVSALQGVRSLLNAYYSFDHARQKTQAYEARMDSAIAFLRRHRDFDGFDRLTFLRDRLAPLSEELSKVPEPTPQDDIVFSKPFDGTFADLLKGKGFDPDAYAGFADSRSTPEKVELGRMLFSEKSLSRASTMSCATCHRPELAFTDGLAKAELKVHGGGVRRNTPTLYYSALQPVQFHDMRSLTLEDQIADVMMNDREFALPPKEAAVRILRDPGKREAVSKAFGNDSLDGYRIRNAIAAYVRTLNPFNSRFDAYMKGDDGALSSEERLGFNLFAGKAKCATCHFIPLFNGTVPPFYSKAESEVIGVPQRPVWTRAVIDSDSGRYLVNRLDPLLYSFKTPGIRNAEKTAPYMHNGVYNTMEEVVRFYRVGGGVGIGIDLPWQTLPFDSLQLTVSDSRALVSFMRSLTDRP